MVVMSSPKKDTATVLPGSAIKDLPNSVHGLVGASYAIGGEFCQFMHPNSPYFGQDPK